MEGADVEIIAQPGFGLGAQIPHQEFTGLVGQGLTGPGDIAQDFCSHIVRRKGRVFQEAGFGVFLAPAHVMHAGIHDETAGPPHLIGQLAKSLIRCGVQAHILGQGLGVEAPSLTKGGDIGLATEIRHTFQFLGDGALVMVSGHGLVNAERWQGVKRALIQGIGVDHVSARNAAFQISRPVATGRVGWRQARWNRSNTVREPRQMPEKAWHGIISPFGDPRRMHQQFFFGLGVELRIGTQEMQEIGK